MHPLRRVEKRKRNADVDPVEFLESEGFMLLQKSMAEIRQSAADDSPFAVADGGGRMTPDMYTDFPKAVKGISSKLQKLHKETIALQWKLKKRVTVPDGVREKMGDFRNVVGEMMTYYQQFVGADVELYLDAAKVERSRRVLLKDSHVPPARFSWIYFIAQSLD